MTLHHAEPRRRYDALTGALGAVGIDVPAEAAETAEFATELADAGYAEEPDVSGLLDRAERTSDGKRTELIDAARDALTLAAARRVHAGDVRDVLGRRAARAWEAARARVVGDAGVADRARALHTETSAAFAADWTTVAEIVDGRVDDVDDLGILVQLPLDGPTAARLAQAHIAARAHAATLDALTEVRAHLTTAPRGRLTPAEAATLTVVAATPSVLDRIVGLADRVPSRLAGWAHVLTVGGALSWADDAEHAERIATVLDARSQAAARDVQRPATQRERTRNDLELASLDRHAGTAWERGEDRPAVSPPVDYVPQM